MQLSSEEILSNMMNLPEEERANLALKIMESLNKNIEEDIELAWQKEISKRLKKIDDGTAEYNSREELKTKTL